MLLRSVLVLLYLFLFLFHAQGETLIIKPNVATWCIMRWNSFSENLQPEKLFRLDCCLSPLITVQARDLNEHLQNTHSSRMQISFMFVFNCLCKPPHALFSVCEIWRHLVVRTRPAETFSQWIFPWVDSWIFQFKYSSLYSSLFVCSRLL